MAASEEYLTALVRLRASPDFAVVLEQMKKDLLQADKDNRRTSGEVLYRSQGRALYIEEFLNRHANARANVEKMRT